MPLITIVQAASEALGLDRPTQALTSSDPNVRRMVALANRVGKDLVSRHRWMNTLREATITTVAAEKQGNLTDLLPGYHWMIPETAWNRTQQEPVGGPLTPGDWQVVQADTTVSPYQDFRIQWDNSASTRAFYMYPAPTAGETVALEYQTQYVALSGGSSGAVNFSDDSDSGTLDEEMYTLGIIYRFKQATGQDYAEDMAHFERYVDNNIAHEVGARTLRLGTPKVVRGVYVPRGAWSL